MKKYILHIKLFLLFVFSVSLLNAQTSSSDNFVIQPIADRTVEFDVTDSGVSNNMIWGLDTAWASLSNIKRGIAFMGADNVDVVRVSYFTKHPLVNGELSSETKEWIDKRFGYLELLGRPMKLTMNSVRESVDASFGTQGNYNAVTWAANIAATIKYYETKGHEVISVSPCNECDLGDKLGNGDKPFSAALNRELRKLPELDGVRISSSTLNNDQALPWYNYLKETLDEGNTHQLAGVFDTYAEFFEVVRTDGNYASNDELHNVIESIVGLEYGLQMGIWWGSPEYAGSQFVKATKGVRLGYAEHRDNWTAAAVYKNPEGKIEAFIGASERQAFTTSYKFISKDRAVFYDGHGPQREYVMQIPAGTGYQVDQPNAERVINIQWGEDIQPAISGMYKLVNRESGKVIQVANGSANDGANLEIGTDTEQIYQQWDLTRVAADVGGDFTYYKIGLGSNTNKKVAVNGPNLDNGGNIITYENSGGLNRQWFLDYVEDGWFYIGSRQSGKFLDADSASENENIRQWEKKVGIEGYSQQWRFIPTTAAVEFDAPNTPTNLIATANSGSIKLEWDANTESDLAGYSILRSNTAGGEYNTIARNVTTTSFVDNSINSGVAYFYKIKAVDNSFNSSDFTNEVSTSISDEDNLIVHLKFDENTLDSSENLNHSASKGSISYESAKIGSKSIFLNGSSTFLQLPTNIANHQEITIATWIYYNGGGNLQRIFDFGNNQDEYMFLSPSSSTGNLSFEINNGSGKQILTSNAGLETGKWSHVAVTLKPSSAILYVNGAVVAESDAITTSPADFKPILNYIGRSQKSDPLLNARIDDFRIYNYTLTGEEIEALLESNNNYTVEVTGETCPDKNNGQITITTSQNSTFTAIINGTEYSSENKKIVLTDLAPSTYDICVITTRTNDEQCYSVNIPKSNSITGKAVSKSGKMSIDIKSGTAPYLVSVNGKIKFETNEKHFEVAVNSGDVLEVKTSKVCEGSLLKNAISFDEIKTYPNPTFGEFDIYLPKKEKSVDVSIYNINGNLVSTSKYELQNGKVRLNLENESAGIYFVKIKSYPENTIKIIKK